MATKTDNLYVRIEPDVKIPTARPANMAEVTEAELNSELEKGYVDMVEGKTKPAKQAFANIRKDYGL